MADIEKIASKDARPIDIVAARVTWAGVHYDIARDANKKLNQELWTDGPPPCIPLPSPGDVRGTTRGRMTIHGYLGPRDLVARCVCGNYERRDLKSWKKGLKDGKDDLGCQECHQTQYLRNKDHFRRTGMNNPFGRRKSEDN